MIVPFAGEYATPADLFKCLAQAAYAREQVYEIESAFRAILAEWQQLLQRVSQISGRVGLPGFPPADGTNPNAQMLGDGCLRMVFASLVQIGKCSVLVAYQSEGGIHDLPLGIFADSMAFLFPAKTSFGEPFHKRQRRLLQQAFAPGAVIIAPYFQERHGYCSAA